MADASDAVVDAEDAEDDVRDSLLLLLLRPNHDPRLVDLTMNRRKEETERRKWRILRRHNGFQFMSLAFLE